MAKENDAIQPLEEGVLQKGGQRPRPETPRPTANPAGQRPNDAKPAGSSPPPKG